MIRVLALSFLAIYQKYKDKSFITKFDETLTIAILIPAFNEESVIKKTINRLLKVDYPCSYEILVVDDDSTDQTLQVLEDYYSNHASIKILSQRNSGKASALNNAIVHTNADIIITLDADTIFNKTTVIELLKMFYDPTVGAVAGNIKVGNKINLLTRFQAIEYITSQNLERRAFKVLDAITVVPGSVGAWRRSLVLCAGGFTNDTLAEDADLTFKIRKLGYHIVFADKVIAYTEAPDTIRVFLKQRYRWMFGTFQVAWKHLDTLFKPRYGYLGFVAMPSIFINQVMLPLIAPLMDLLLVSASVSLVINRIYHPLDYYPATFILILKYYVLFTVIDFITGYISFILERNEKKLQLLLLIPQRFFYRQLIYYVAIKTILSALSGKNVTWDKIVRKATVTENA